MGFGAGAIGDSLNDRRAQHDVSQFCSLFYDRRLPCVRRNCCKRIKRVSSWQEGTKSEEAEASASLQASSEVVRESPTS